MHWSTLLVGTLVLVNVGSIFSVVSPIGLYWQKRDKGSKAESNSEAEKASGGDIVFVGDSVSLPQCRNTSTAELYAIIDAYRFKLRYPVSNKKLFDGKEMCQEELLNDVFYYCHLHQNHTQERCSQLIAEQTIAVQIEEEEEPCAKDVLSREHCPLPESTKKIYFHFIEKTEIAPALLKKGLFREVPACCDAYYEQLIEYCLMLYPQLGKGGCMNYLERLEDLPLSSEAPRTRTQAPDSKASSQPTVSQVTSKPPASDNTEASVSQTRTEPSVSEARSKPSASAATTEQSVSAAKTESSVSESNTEPSVSEASSEPSASAATTEPSVSTANTEPSVSQTLTETSVSEARSEPSASAATTEPSVSTANTEPSVSEANTEPSVSEASSEPSASAATTEPSVSTANTEPSVSQTRTEPSVSEASSEHSASAATTEPSVSTANTEPSVSNANTEPSVSEASSEPSDSEASTKPSVSEASSEPSVSESSSQPSISEASSAPSVSEASSPPSVSEASSGPSVSEASSAPSVSEASSAPSVSEASSKSSVSEANTVPSVSEANTESSVSEVSSLHPVSEAASSQSPSADDHFQSTTSAFTSQSNTESSDNTVSANTAPIETTTELNIPTTAEETKKCTTYQSRSLYIFFRWCRFRKSHSIDYCTAHIFADESPKCVAKHLENVFKYCRRSVHGQRHCKKAVGWMPLSKVETTSEPDTTIVTTDSQCTMRKVLGNVFVICRLTGRSVEVCEKRVNANPQCKYQYLRSAFDICLKNYGNEKYCRYVMGEKQTPTDIDVAETTQAPQQTDEERCPAATYIALHFMHCRISHSYSSCSQKYFKIESCIDVYKKVAFGICLIDFGKDFSHCLRGVGDHPDIITTVTTATTSTTESTDELTSAPTSSSTSESIGGITSDLTTEATDSPTMTTATPPAKSVCHFVKAFAFDFFMCRQDGGSVADCGRSIRGSSACEEEYENAIYDVCRDSNRDHVYCYWFVIRGFYPEIKPNSPESCPESSERNSEFISCRMAADGSFSKCFTQARIFKNDLCFDIYLEHIITYCLNVEDRGEKICREVAGVSATVPTDPTPKPVTPETSTLDSTGTTAEIISSTTSRSPLLKCRIAAKGAALFFFVCRHIQGRSMDQCSPWTTILGTECTAEILSEAYKHCAHKRLLDEKYCTSLIGEQTNPATTIPSSTTEVTTTDAEDVTNVAGTTPGSQCSNESSRYAIVRFYYCRDVDYDSVQNCFNSLKIQQECQNNLRHDVYQFCIEEMGRSENMCKDIVGYPYYPQIPSLPPQSTTEKIETTRTAVTEHVTDESGSTPESMCNRAPSLYDIHHFYICREVQNDDAQRCINILDIQEECIDTLLNGVYKYCIEDMHRSEHECKKTIGKPPYPLTTSPVLQSTTPKIESSTTDEESTMVSGHTTPAVELTTTAEEDNTEITTARYPSKCYFKNSRVATFMDCRDQLGYSVKMCLNGLVEDSCIPDFLQFVLMTCQKMEQTREYCVGLVNDHRVSYTSTQSPITTEIEETTTNEDHVTGVQLTTSASDFSTTDSEHITQISRSTPGESATTESENAATTASSSIPIVTGDSTETTHKFTAPSSESTTEGHVTPVEGSTTSEPETEAPTATSMDLDTLLYANGEFDTITLEQSDYLGKVCGRPKSNDDGFGLKIGGGHIPNKHEFPWSAAIRINPDLGETETICTGTLISDRHVLTSASCVFSVDKGRILTDHHEIALGGECTDPTAECQMFYDWLKVTEIRKVKNSFVFEQWKNTRNVAQIGIIELDEPVKFTKEVTPICLPRVSDVNPGIVHYGIHYGWGREKGANLSAPLMKYIETEIATCPAAEETKTLDCVCAQPADDAELNIIYEDEGAGLQTSVNDKWVLLGSAANNIGDTKVVCNTDHRHYLNQLCKATGICYMLQ